MTYSYTQIAQYLRCPRSYRYRYLDGWKEKDSRANLLFGRCFELALGAYFRREDSAAALFAEWAKYRDCQVEFSHGDSWDKMFRQGVQLLERLAQHCRIEISQPRQNMQVKLLRQLANGNDFVSYIDAIGDLDDKPCLLEWKTTTARYPEEPNGLLALDPQLICYSWISGISEVALVAFVRKRFCEIQYLKTTITDQQRDEFGRIVETTVGHIEAGEFLAHSGIRFPQNGCITCPQLGLCLGKPIINASDNALPSDFPCQLRGKNEILLRCDFGVSVVANATGDTKPGIVLNSLTLSFETNEDSHMLVELTLMNQGITRIVDPWTAYLSIDSASGKNLLRRPLVHVDFRELVPGKPTTFSESFLAPSFRPGLYAISLWMPSSDPSLRFDPLHNLLLSNVGMADPATGLNQVALLTVLP